MKENKNQPLIEYAKDYIIDHIDNIDRKQIHGCPADLAVAITEMDTNNGTILNNEEESFKTICTWKYEAGAYIDRYKNLNYVERDNPFWHPGKFMVKLVTFSIVDILYQMDFLCPMYDFKLTKKLQKEILTALKGVKKFSFE